MGNCGLCLIPAALMAVAVMAAGADAFLAAPCSSLRAPCRVGCKPAFARSFEFVPYASSYAGARRSICADGLVEGADLHLTHWTNNKTPMEYKADLSTEIVFKWVKLQAAARRVKGVPDGDTADDWSDAVVLNNHFDTDGLMSAWALLEPEKALEHESVMVAAAAAGDFDEWGISDRGVILDIALTKLAERAGDDEKAYEELLPRMEELLKTIPKQPELWQEELLELEKAFDLVCDEVITVDRLEDKKTKFSHAQGEVGDIGIIIHPKGVSRLPGPVLSRTFRPVLKGEGKSVGRILLASEQDDGTWSYVYQRPNYAWADTVTRPLCTKPNAQLLVDTLGAPWSTDVADEGMTAICKTLNPMSRDPAQVADELLTCERSILPAGLRPT